MPHRHTMTRQEWVDFEAAFELMRAIATGDTKRAMELRLALASEGSLPATPAPQEGDDVYADTDGQRMVHAEQRIAELTAALAAATARADEWAAKLLRAEASGVVSALEAIALKAEAERLRGENATLEAHVASLVWHAERWLELRKVAVVTRNEDGELGLMAFLPEPNPRPLDIAVTAPEEVEAEVNIAFDLPRALPATPAPRGGKGGA